MPTTLDQDLLLLRRAISIAERSRAGGNHPFGALLAGPHGDVLLEAENSCGTLGDRTGHAERNLMTEASRKYDDDFLASCTMYTSTEPCAMCAGAVFWAGVGRVVYGLSGKGLIDLISPDQQDLTMDLPCRQVFAAGQRPLEVLGPLIEDEARPVHDGFWDGL